METKSNSSQKDRLSLLIKNSQDAILIYDVDQDKFVDCTQNSLILLNRIKANLQKLGLFDICKGLKRASANSKINEALAGGNPIFGMTLIDGKNKEIPCQIRLSRLQIPDSNLLWCCLLDTRKEIATLAKVEYKKQRLQPALKISDIGSFDWFPEESKIIWDRRMHQIYGLSERSKKNRNEYFFSILHPDDQIRIQESFESILDPATEDEFLEDEYQILTKRGIRHIHTNGKTIRSEDGALIRLIGTCQDITERLTMEGSHQKDEEHYGRLLASIPSIFWTTNRDGMTSYISSNV